MRMRHLIIRVRLDVWVRNYWVDCGECSIMRATIKAIHM